MARRGTRLGETRVYEMETEARYTETQRIMTAYKGISKRSLTGMACSIESHEDTNCFGVPHF